MFIFIFVFLFIFRLHRHLPPTPNLDPALGIKIVGDHVLMDHRVDIRICCINEDGEMYNFT